MSDKMSIDKQEHSKDNTDEESPASTPDNEAGPSAPQETQPAKRKGGRKPIYATSEERKQRNRQAQAAFRERRTEYIKQLEETIRVHESNLSNLQAAHRSAADECLMLRYKNSLLERILLEKGIDVQAELRAKTGSPNLGPTHMAPNMVQPPPIQRTMFNRNHHSRRSTSSIAPKLEPIANSLPPPVHGLQAVSSPKTARPTPPSHAASPTNPNPGAFSQSMTSPTTADQPAMRSALPQPMRPPLPPMQGPMAAAAARQQMLQAGSNPAAGAGAGARAAPYYPGPAFQNHIEQLEQEYDAPNDMIDDVESDTPNPGPYPGQFPGGQQPPQQSHQQHPLPHPHNHHPSQPPPQQQQQQQHQQQQQQQQHGIPMQPGAPGAPTQQPMPAGDQQQQPGNSQGGQGYPSMTQLLDPALDWDPFGLSASMAFPTQFSFDTSNMR